MSRQQQLLTDRETFERYESHSRPQSTTFSGPQRGHGDHGQLGCEYRMSPQPGPRTFSYPEHGQLACEYRQAPNSGAQGYSQQPQLACEYRQRPQFDDGPSRFEGYKSQPAVTTFLPSTSNKPRVPLGMIVAIAIAVPILIIVCLFGAVWLQELGVL